MACRITIASLLSFIAGAFAASKHVCYAAVASGSVVLILPGYIVLCGSLELASRSIISGSVRLCYSIIYSIFLGFGLSIGAELFHAVSGQRVLGADDYQCTNVHNPNGPWWQRDASPYWGKFPFDWAYAHSSDWLGSVLVCAWLLIVFKFEESKSN